MIVLIYHRLKLLDLIININIFWNILIEANFCEGSGIQN
jgi:hypothetical protein